MKANELSNEELKKEYEAMCQAIDQVGIYGKKDVQWRNALEFEINSRKGKISKGTTIKFPENEDENTIERLEETARKRYLENSDWDAVIEMLDEKEKKILNEAYIRVYDEEYPTMIKEEQ